MRLRKIGCLLTLAVGLSAAAAAAAENDGFVSLFNGKDLSGWEGDPALWSVEDGAITGKTTDQAVLPYNKFLIWRGGKPKNFELRALVRQSGNNSGIQYRSRELPEVGPWSVGGYQMDIHPQPANNAMLYEERGRGIVAQNGQKVIIEPNGDKWVVTLGPPVEVKVEDWNEYTIIAQGNHLIHKLNGKVTVDVIDHQASARALEGIIALQLHRGPAMRVQFKDIQLKVLPDGGLISPDQTPIPAGAQKVSAKKPPAAAGKAVRAKKAGKKKL